MIKSISIVLFLFIFFNNSESKPLFFKHHVVLRDSVSKEFSTKKLGSFVHGGKTFFRLFAPNANSVALHTFNSVEQTKGTRYRMKKDKDGVWETELDGEHYGLFYGYKVLNKKHKSSADVLCIDPYTRAVATYNSYMNPRKSIVVKPEQYNWEGDEWIQQDWRDLIIYEMHIKDMTAHPSSGADNPGSYHALIQKGKPGGIDYIKSLGVNTVELLPAQEFGNIEIPYMDTAFGRYNTWNPYSRNHWGYMTAAFFAPDAYFSEKPVQLKWDTWSGASGKQINDFKDMVKAFHKEGIAVIMDVVYNHISEYELGNLKEIDRDYYFRIDDKGNFRSESGTGNDLKTENPMVRRLIIENVLFWMKEYHIDGFRFDLAKMLDWVTIEDILHEARKINPHVVIVGEPWGGGYDPTGFSVRQWGSWNDQIRNGIKGENPVNGHGWIFGKWYGDNNPLRIKSYVNGTLEKDHGFFQKKEHSVNYLESHDGYTLGDFIRIGCGELKPDTIISEKQKNAALSPDQLKLNKLAALFLFTSQGITMISEGQEFARSKVIAPFEKDRSSGRLDHNSYEKDNETNFINYKHAEINKELIDYYKGLIKLRNIYPQFRRAEYDEIKFFTIKSNEFALGYSIEHQDESFIVLFNANHSLEEAFTLPEGEWDILTDKNKAGVEVLRTISGSVIVESTTGIVLKKKRSN